MKNYILNLGLTAFLLVTIVGCQKDEISTQEVQEFQISDIKSATEQFVSVEDISNTAGMSALVEKMQDQQNLTTKRVGCTLDSDIECGGPSAVEIEEYVNLSGCISFTQGTLMIPIQSRNFTYNYSYYIDGDGDINMDQFQFQFISHVADIERRISPKKIALVSADASNGCYNERGWNVDNVTYTVILGN